MSTDLSSAEVARIEEISAQLFGVSSILMDEVMEEPGMGLQAPMGRCLKILLGVVMMLGALWLAGIYMLTFGLGIVLSWIY